jgi:tetratricopeptide (TPR) repeat protein
VVADAHTNLGTVQRELGQHELALQSFRRAIQLDPDHATACFNLGVIYLELNNKSAALAQYAQLKSRDAKLVRRLYEGIYSNKVVNVSQMSY